jgi:hypothetical protein
LHPAPQENLVLVGFHNGGSWSIIPLKVLVAFLCLV